MYESLTIPHGSLFRLDPDVHIVAACPGLGGFRLNAAAECSRLNCLGCYRLLRHFRALKILRRTQWKPSFRASQTAQTAQTALFRRLSEETGFCSGRPAQGLRDSGYHSLRKERPNTEGFVWKPCSSTRRMKSLRQNPQIYSLINNMHKQTHAGLGHVRCRVDTILKRKNLHLQIPGLFGNLFPTTCCKGSVTVFRLGALPHQDGWLKRR